jgi:hypothetical protein
MPIISLLARYAAIKNVLVVVAAGNSLLDLDEDRNCTPPECFEGGSLLKVAEMGFWETKVGQLQSLWTFPNPQPNPQHEMSCTTSAA